MSHNRNNNNGLTSVGKFFVVAASSVAATGFIYYFFLRKPRATCTEATSGFAAQHTAVSDITTPPLSTPSVSAILAASPAASALARGVTPSTSSSSDSSHQRRIKFDPGSESSQLLNYINAMVNEVPADLTDRQEQIVELLSRRVTKSTTDRLIVGNVQRHTGLPAYGMRGRDEVMNSLIDALLGFKCGNKDKTPLCTVTSLPRQGKTLFLDSVANSEGIVKALRGDRNNTFIFNISFNSSWQVPENSTTTLVQARAAIFIRLFAAAADLSYDDIDDNDKLMTALAEKLTLRQFARLLVKVIAGVRQAPTYRSTIFLFDEFTNVTRQVQDEQVCKQVYSEISSLIGKRSAVICSGFTQVPDYDLSTSGRPLEHLELTIINDFERRRQLLAMKTRLFQQRAVATQNINNIKAEIASKTALYTYELVKSSPGVLGAIIENPSKDGPAFGIKFLRTLLNAEKYVELGGKKISIHFHMMRRTLQFKSVQFLASVSGNARKVIARDLRLAESLGVVQLQNAEKIDVDDVRIEPYFLAIMFKSDSPNVPTTNDDEFLLWKYLKMLESYSEASLVVGSESDEGNQLVASTEQSRFLVGDPNSNVCPAKASPDLHRLNGSFFEAAVAVGFLAQRQHQHQLLAESESELREQLAANNGLRFSLRQLLPDATLLLSSTGGFPSFSMKIRLPDPSSSFRGKIQPFKGDFPCRLPDREKDHNKDPNFATYFDSNIVLVPERPENNPRVDVICHDELAEEMPTTSAASSASGSSTPENEVQGKGKVQYWLDIKHSEKNPFVYDGEKNLDLEVLRQMIFESDDEFKSRPTTTGGYKYATHVRSALSNPLFQPPSTIRHIVHIVISPCKLPPPKAGATGGQTQAKIDAGRYSTSYTLVLVSPDSLAFENLVSQSIARSIPLLDQQHVDAWATTVPAPANWWKYKATTQKLPESVTTSRDFKKWTNCLFLDDAAATCLGNLFASKEEAVRVLEDCLVDSGDERKIPQLLSIPFGCFLECFGIIPLKRSPTGAPLHFSDDFSVTIKQRDDQKKMLVVKRLLETTNLAYERELLDALRCNIRVGHIFEGLELDVRVFPGSDFGRKRNLASTLWQTSFDGWNVEKVRCPQYKSWWEPVLKAADERIADLNLQQKLSI